MAVKQVLVYKVKCVVTLPHSKAGGCEILMQASLARGWALLWKLNPLPRPAKERTPLAHEWLRREQKLF